MRSIGYRLSFELLSSRFDIRSGDNQKVSILYSSIESFERKILENGCRYFNFFAGLCEFITMRKLYKQK